jgi:hypothetical protein
MKDQNDKTPGTGDLRVALNPGSSAVHLMAAAMEKRARAGGGRISLKHFLWPDYRMLPALAHPAGKALAAARRRA